jgi:2-oxoglutarate dehydrogenase E1 component
MGEGKIPLDWGMAENLAYASLVDEKHPVRFSGRTRDAGPSRTATPCCTTRIARSGIRASTSRCRTSARGQANFVVIDSLSSEEAVLGFEYGYATAQPFELGDLGSAVRRLRERRRW